MPNRSPLLSADNESNSDTEIEMFQIAKYLNAFRAAEIENLKAENTALKEILRQFRELADTLPLTEGFAQTGPYIAGVRYACLRITQILDGRR